MVAPVVVRYGGRLIHVSDVNIAQELVLGWTGGSDDTVAVETHSCVARLAKTVFSQLEAT